MTAGLESPKHPLRTVSGKFAHELDEPLFKAWLQRSNMTEHDYWMTLGTSEDLTTKYGHPVTTAKLTSDQLGWAKQRFGDHYRTPGAKWYVRSDKPNVPVPAVKMTRGRYKKKRHH